MLNQKSIILLLSLYLFSIVFSQSAKNCSVVVDGAPRYWFCDHCTSCGSIFDHCGFPISEGYCAVQGTKEKLSYCVPNGFQVRTRRGTVTCQVCDSAMKQDGYSIAAEGVECDDGVYCNGKDYCSGISMDCDAGTHTGDPCVENGVCNTTCQEKKRNCHANEGAFCVGVCGSELCDGKGGCNILYNNCFYCEDGVTCDDGIFCNGEDFCVDRKCDGHKGNPCTGNSVCTSMCDEMYSECTSLNYTPCDKGACINNTCVAGVCGDGMPCGDGNFCRMNNACLQGECIQNPDPCTGNPTCSAYCDTVTEICSSPANTVCIENERVGICSNGNCNTSGAITTTIFIILGSLSLFVIILFIIVISMYLKKDHKYVKIINKAE